MAGLGIAKLQFKSDGGSPPPAPTLDSVSAAELVVIDCGVPWEVRASWNTTNGNDSLYEIQVFTYGGSVLATGLTSGDSSWDDVTSLTGDPAFSDFTHSRRYTIKLVRLSDSNVMATLDTGTVTRDSSAAC